MMAHVRYTKHPGPSLQNQKIVVQKIAQETSLIREDPGCLKITPLCPAESEQLTGHI